jgi:putative ABC transport system permease protein
MFKNYFFVSIRHIVRDKSVSVINIVGLAIGMACVIVILLWIRDELSYDKFHGDYDRIFHVYLRVYDPRSAFNFQPTTSHELGQAMLDKIPEIEKIARMGALGELGMKYGDKLFLERSGFAADPEIFEIFNYQFIYGHPDNVLAEPNSIVLTETFSKKYFGTDIPVGKVVQINNRIDLKVTGVIRDLPAQTHRQFDFLVPFSLLKNLGFFIDFTGNLFSNCVYHNYIKLNQNAVIEDVKQKVPELFNFQNDNIRGEAFLVPIIQTNRYNLIRGNLLIYVFAVLGILILLIACINFINISTARSVTRSTEVGLRKIFGAGRKHLIVQFLGEAFIITLIALNFAIILVSLFLPAINNLTGKEMHLDYLDPVLVVFLLIIWIITAVIAGSYPSFLLSAIKPVKILQIHHKIGSGRSVLRKFLVVAQFTFAALFLFCTIIISRQFYFMDHSDPGYRTEGMVYVRLRDATRQKADAFKNELRKIPGVISSTNTSHLPVLIAGGYYQEWGKPEREESYLCETRVDYDYLNTLDLKMASGRFYSPDYASDSIDAIVVNEMAIRQMDLDQPVGKKFLYRGEYYNIIGIIKDFHHLPLGLQITPLLFKLNPRENDFMLIHIRTGNHQDLLRIVEQIAGTWVNLFPEHPFELNFLEDYQFPQERIFISARKLVFFFTVLSILISCMGLFGLSNYMAERRVKEIGIRKTMGSSSL